MKLTDVTPISEPFPVDCCVENVELVKVELVKDSETKNQYLDFYYQKDGGKFTLRDRRFPVKKESLSMFQKEGETLKQTEERLQNELGRVLLHIASRVVPEEDIALIEGENFEELGTSFSEVVNKHCKGVKLFVKTTLNKNGYVSLPKAGRFLQKQEDGTCTLSYTEKEKKDIATAMNRETDREGIRAVSDSSV